MSSIDSRTKWCRRYECSPFNRGFIIHTQAPHTHKQVSRRVGGAHSPSGGALQFEALKAEHEELQLKLQQHQEEEQSTKMRHLREQQLAVERALHESHLAHNDALLGARETAEELELDLRAKIKTAEHSSGAQLLENGKVRADPLETICGRASVAGLGRSQPGASPAATPAAAPLTDHLRPNMHLMSICSHDSSRRRGTQLTNKIKGLNKVVDKLQKLLKEHDIAVPDAVTMK